MVASAVLFAKDLEKVTTFYTAVTGLEQIDWIDGGFCLLGERQFRFYIVLISEFDFRCYTRRKATQGARGDTNKVGVLHRQHSTRPASGTKPRRHHLPT